MSDMAWSDDLFERKVRADFLSNYLDEDICRVLNLDSPWGAGKTYFLKNWRFQLLSESSRPVVYFNAWENDFLGDPLLSLVSVIRDQLSAQGGKPSQIKGKVKEFTKRAGELAVAIAPSIIKAAAKKHLGEDFLEVLDGEVTSEAAEKFVENVLNKNQEALNAVDHFRTSLGELFKAASSNSEGKPVYIFIDELDRCRPTYAIELLERVKHFFAIEGCRFVIATDTDQLAHSICAVYGAGFSSKRYLKRFFDSTFKLDNTLIDNWIVTNIKNEICPPFNNYKVFEMAGGRPQFGFGDFVEPAATSIFSNKLNSHQIVFKALVMAFNFQIRDLEAILKRLHTFNGYFKEGGWDFFFCTYLLFLIHSDVVIKAWGSYYEDLDFWKELNSKYPVTSTLYTGVGNISVHELARIYFRMLSTAGRELMDLANGKGMESPVALDVMRKTDVYIKSFEVAKLSAELT
ncbi:P-loop NTPase fold protein [Pseudomonas mediterranea]|uniref:KAP family P-loop NTPase fold protein n=1 Tax=Pseudomonas mediterranea TaxID=183795 RepID=UPI00191FDFA9|nr:P-loop NTPase fold protein [Pseudomonas mediterranea]MBL0840763.1 P-loop ATPase [Pseudomonas mediterranea]